MATTTSLSSSPSSKHHHRTFFPLFLILLLLLQPLYLFANFFPIKRCSYNAIYQFGDSISDTGNLIREGPAGAFSPFAHLPYGETYFNKPTGRCSNGLLMIDWLAKVLELPLLNPYLDKEANFEHGVNFAVAGSTALETSFLAQNFSVIAPVTNSSLLVQFEWFMTHLNSMCSSKSAECAQLIEKALFMVGEVGGNDYNYAFAQGKTIDEVKNLVPYVVSNIVTVAKKLIDLGAVRLVVPGNFPIGCLPVYLTTYKTNDSTAYDEIKCLKGLNEFAMFHNSYLQKELNQLREEHPNVVILYADYFNALQWILRHASYLGFEEGSTMKACCGTGGEYNFDLAKLCGTEGVSACSNPNLRVSWDGIHLTEKAYEHMTAWLVSHLWLESQCIY